MTDYATLLPPLAPPPKTYTGILRAKIERDERFIRYFTTDYPQLSSEAKTRIKIVKEIIAKLEKEEEMP